MTRTKGLGTLAAVVSTCIVLVCIVGIFTPRPARDAAPAAVAAVEQSESTATTAPVEPTASPEPTAVPRPTQARPVLDAASVAYLRDVSEQLAIIGGAEQQFGILMEKPRLADDDWRLAVVANMAGIVVAHQTLVQMTPPAGFEAIHAAILDSTGDADAATRAYARGLDNLSAADISRGNQLMLRAASKLPKAKALLLQKQAELQP